MILNYQLQHHETSGLSPMIFIHGLFGSLSNLGILARLMYVIMGFLVIVQT